MSNKFQSQGDLTGCRVLILRGPYKGCEGVCVGRSQDGEHWAISPNDSREILHLRFEKEFGLLVDLSSDPKEN